MLRSDCRSLDGVGWDDLRLHVTCRRLLAERGCRFVRLCVDALNATGALDLSVRAGRRMERRFEVFEKGDRGVGNRSGA
jgi:hypothetical protein